MRHAMLLSSVAVAVAFWGVESVIHCWFFDPHHGFEIIPHDANELWMRTLIFLLIVGFGFYANRAINKIKDSQNERLRVLRATMYTVHDVVNNFLNSLHLLRLEAEDDGGWSAESLARFDAIVRQTTGKLTELGELDQVTEIDLGDGRTAIEIPKPPPEAPPDPQAPQAAGPQASDAPKSPKPPPNGAA